MTPDLLCKGRHIHISSDIFVISMILMDVFNSPYFFVDITIIPVHFYCLNFCFKLCYCIVEITFTFLFSVCLKPIQIIKKNIKKPQQFHLGVAKAMGIIFWEFLILYQIFCSPQVKRSMNISNKYGIDDLPHDLPNDFRPTILVN